MKAISLDIETLDTTTSAIVLSIGACVVVPGRPIDELPTFHKRVAIQEQINAGRTISESTLRFWMDQAPTVRHSAMGEPGRPVRYVLDALAEWWQEQGCPPVYTKGPQFDAAIIDDLADTFAIDRPIHYRKWRDVRTLAEMITWGGNEELLISVRENSPFNGRLHDALADARKQAEDIALAMNLIEESKA